MGQEIVSTEVLAGLSSNVC